MVFESNLSFFINPAFFIILGVFAHTVYVENLEPRVLAPKGKLRFEIKEALEKTFELTSKNGVASEAAQTQKCHLEKPERRKLALGKFPKLQEKMENRRSHLLLSCDKQGLSFIKIKFRI